MKGYYIFSALAFVLFIFAQYNGYGIFDSSATERTTGQTDTRTIFHK